MTTIDQRSDLPAGGLWTLSQIIAAVLWVGSLITMGMLPVLLVAIFIILWLIRLTWRLLKASTIYTHSALSHHSTRRRTARLQASLRQSQALTQVAPRVAAAQDFGEVVGLLSNIKGLQSSSLNSLTTLNTSEKAMLDAVNKLGQANPADKEFQARITAAQSATDGYLEHLTSTPALPAAELAEGWLSFHEETRMSVQEISAALARLADTATSLDELKTSYEERAVLQESDGDQQDTRATPPDLPFDVLTGSLATQLDDLTEDTKPQVFHELFELSQSIDAAFQATGRQPPHQLGLVSDDVRRVHQIEALLSVYREKIDRLDQEMRDGKVNEDTYATMKQSWQRILESELSKLEADE